MRVETSMAAIGPKWTVAPTTGWPGCVAAPPITRAPDELTTVPVIGPMRLATGRVWLAAVLRAISVASTRVSTDAPVQKRRDPRILWMSAMLSRIIVLLCGHQNGATGITKTNETDQWLDSTG